MMLGEQTDGENDQPECCDCTPIHRFAFAFDPRRACGLNFTWNLD
jgi:hypothetical protein